MQDSLFLLVSSLQYDVPNNVRKMFGRQTAKRVVFEPPKDSPQKYYQKDLNDPPPMRDIPIEINTSPHITVFERHNQEKKMMPGPGYYEVPRDAAFKRPASQLRMPATVVTTHNTDGRDFTFDIHAYRKTQDSVVCHKFNTSDRWKSGQTLMDKFVQEQRRAQSQCVQKRKRSKFCE